MSTVSKLGLRKVQRQEDELHFVVNPLSTVDDLANRRARLDDHDYQAPLLSYTLWPNSKWTIVRNNLHRIRSWGAMKSISGADGALRDWYLFFQMRRELKRVEEQIRAIEHRSDFEPIRHFDMAVDAQHTRRYNVSHVQSNDGIYYAGLGSEPIVLQYLLFYFSKDCIVTYDDIFYSFLTDVTSVLDTNRQRIHRFVVLRLVALIMALAVFAIIIIMFFALVVSVLTTTSNLREMYDTHLAAEIKWQSTNLSRNVHPENT